MASVFRVAQREDYQELARWIVGILSVPEQHCLHSWSGESADTLYRQLLSYLAASELCYLIAIQDDQLVGAMGCEYDGELGRGN
jgi:hypothetical protein